MLRSLHIENFALIRHTDIQFDDGFVVITGETGAGKSIMLGALGLLLGQRADTTVLAEKEKKCVVEALFYIDGLNLQPLFEEADVDYDDRLIVRREILPSAKSRAFVNDTPVQLPFLKKLGSRIIDIHSQHETLTLANSDYRLALLDSLAGGSERDRYAEAYHRYASLKRELETLTTREAENRKEQDYMQFQLNELLEARLTVGEQEALEEESHLLSHAEEVREGLAAVVAALDDENEQAGFARLRQAKAALARVADYHHESADLLQRLDSALLELEDIDSSAIAAAESINYSAERHQYVDERLALLYRLEKKHDVTSVEQLVAIRDALDSRLQSMSTLDSRIQELMEQVDGAFTAVQQAATQLTRVRRSAGEGLAAGIVPILSQLGMPEVRFRVEITPAATFGPQGCDTVAFLFNANKGGEMRDIAMVASGGELSRLMLAIKSMHVTHTLLPTIIFDEIDTGVSGDIAGAVGLAMRRMAARMQVVAITHLPQIAAQAGQHLKVYKESDDERTVSRIRQLDDNERTTEVAIMLSADPPTAAALQTARELRGKSYVNTTT